MQILHKPDKTTTFHLKKYLKNDHYASKTANLLISSQKNGTNIINCQIISTTLTNNIFLMLIIDPSVPKLKIIKNISTTKVRLC